MTTATRTAPGTRADGTGGGADTCASSTWASVSRGNVLDKTGTRDRTQLAIWAYQHGLSTREGWMIDP